MIIRPYIICLLLLFSTFYTSAQTQQASKPWVFWYWMQASVSKAGITADLEAMKSAGIGGAYLMPIKGIADPPLYQPTAEQLSPRWWDMIKFALNEAKRLDLQIGMHVSDGFALAGGPWITPELSMQKVVFSKITTDKGRNIDLMLPKPQANEGFYRDIAVYAYPSANQELTTHNVIPRITTSIPGKDASFLITENNKEGFKSSDSCWIQYEFEKPFTCRTVKIRTGGNNYQAQRLLVEVSNDGKNYRSLGRLEAPRHGWQDTDADITHSIIPTSARFFRFIFNKEGSEPGSEDLDAAKWKPSLKLTGLELSSIPAIHQYEGKTGEVWRVSKRTTEQQVPDSLCVPADKIINISSYMNKQGELHWKAPENKTWTIVRIGHTSTGHTNATGGGAKGLECDKFNPAAIKLQFDKWYGEALRRAGPLVPKVLSTFHVDSWECGSQNWSDNFAAEFKKRRGYDLLPFLLVMTGVPVQSASVSENVLYDVRKTIAELVVDKFYSTLSSLSKARGLTFTAESVAPTMLSDGMLHYKKTDVPMGEFWLNSPTHDKPNDMLDAISGAHIYGKKIIQAEAFTTVRMAWNEYPGMLKTLQDRNYALGINKLVYHVFTHNPWMDRKPGMTLDGVGLYFQRDQTWWKPGKAWVEYAQRCQALLQRGNPVADIAVFTGEELPRRAVLPDRLVNMLPGIFGSEVVAAETKRLENTGQPLREKPDGVFHSANMADPENWVNPLRGYAYDSFNPDALDLAVVKNKKIIFPGGSYSILIVPGKHALNPNYQYMSYKTAKKLLELVKSGATVVLAEKPLFQIGFKQTAKLEFERVVNLLWDGPAIKDLGEGRIIKAPYNEETFNKLGVERDFLVKENAAASGDYAKKVTYTHRKEAAADIYFISNQLDKERVLTCSFRLPGYHAVPQIYDAVTNRKSKAKNWSIVNGRITMPVRLANNGSLFIIFDKEGTKGSPASGQRNWQQFETVQHITGKWQVTFDPGMGGPKKLQTFYELYDWSKSKDSLIRYYSGTATYAKTFNLDSSQSKQLWLCLGEIANIAEVKVNGISCGAVWTKPYRLNITKALRNGINHLEIEITNTWANRLIGDHNLPESKRITQTTAPYRLDGKPLQKSGLLGPVTLQVVTNDELKTN